MSSHEAIAAPRTGAHGLGAPERLAGHVRLRTLTNLRWLAVAGQSSAVMTVALGLGHPLPLGWCIAAIAASVWLNLFSYLRFSPQRIVSDREAAAYLAFDIVQLAVLLFLTGGLFNPFAVLLLAPVTIAASALPARLAAGLSAMTVLLVAGLAVAHFDLPWRDGAPAPQFPNRYTLGVWAALTLGIGFSAAYAHRIAAERRQMSYALSAAELILAREERLSALGGLAAAAAHELGTPLATILLTAKEMAREHRDDPGLAEDAALLASQAERCREILGRLSNRGDEGDLVHDRTPLDGLVEEAAAPFLDGAGDIPPVRVRLVGPSEEAEPPVVRRRPEILYGLRNFIENASQHAASEVVLSADWSGERIAVSVSDDGPGFPPDLLPRLGEPYVSGRARGRGAAREKGGMGLGFFIAKTLLEHTGARVRFENAGAPNPEGGSGAWVCAEWPAETLTAPEPTRPDRTT